MLLPLTRLGRAARLLVVAGLAGLLALTVLAAPARAANRPTPGDFRGFGFDQCQTPSQAAMNAWLYYSPFQAVGVYLSGNSRFCRSQPNLTASWVTTQLHNGWRLLPITLGPQAYCSTRFPRYGADIDPVIRKNPDNLYANARAQGNREALTAVAAAKRIGIVPGSTLWYDIEAFDIGNAQCRDSTMWFLHGWTYRLRQLGYVSGVYSSAASGIRAIEESQTRLVRSWQEPERLWIADWDGRANLVSAYVAAANWPSGKRMKQYRGGHDERWGGVRINIDSNWIVLGNATGAQREAPHCGGINVNFGSYATLRPGTVRKYQVMGLKCLLKEQGYYNGGMGGVYTSGLIAAADRFRAANHRPRGSVWTPRDWVALTSHGARVTMKYGSTDPAVHRLQRAMNAAMSARLDVNGVFDAATRDAVRVYQSRVGLAATGHAAPTIWGKLFIGAR